MLYEVITGFLWGLGMMLWGKAIDHIGMSLGFSIFIGTIIVVGSMLPWVFSGVPETGKIIPILVGIAIILAGIIYNGRAGILRQAAEGGAENAGTSSMATGIIIAVVGGILCTGFNVALEVQKLAEVIKIGDVEVGSLIEKAVVENGNDKWLASIASMFIVYVSGGLFVVPYFLVMLTKKKLWGSYNFV